MSVRSACGASHLVGDAVAARSSDAFESSGRGEAFREARSWYSERLESDSSSDAAGEAARATRCSSSRRRQRTRRKSHAENDAESAFASESEAEAEAASREARGSHSGNASAGIWSCAGEADAQRPLESTCA